MGNSVSICILVAEVTKLYFYNYACLMKIETQVYAFSSQCLDIRSNGSTIENTKFENTKFENTKFENTKFENTKFENAKFENTKFENTKLNCVDKREIYLAISSLGICNLVNWLRIWELTSHSN